MNLHKIYRNIFSFFQFKKKKKPDNPAFLFFSMSQVGTSKGIKNFISVSSIVFPNVTKKNDVIYDNWTGLKMEAARTGLISRCIGKAKKLGATDIIVFADYEKLELIGAKFISQKDSTLLPEQRRVINEEMTKCQSLLMVELYLKIFGKGL